MALQVVVGKGSVGSAVAEVLRAAGHEVRLLSRSGGGGGEGVEALAVDATDAEALTTAAHGAAALYNCLNPEYHRWTTDWPPMAAALLTAAERTGAVLATTGNLYGYGDPQGRPLTEDAPLAATGSKGRVRVAMWQAALAAHEAGRVRAFEVRSSDYVGPRVLQTGHLGERVVPKVLAGKKVQLLGDPDAAHSFSYVPDVARALVTAAGDERAWGRAWHVPTAPPVSQRQAVALLCELAGCPPVQVGRVPWTAVRALGLVQPIMREMQEMRFSIDRPYVLDSSAFTTTFGQQPTTTREALAATLAWWQDRLATPLAA